MSKEQDETHLRMLRSFAAQSVGLGLADVQLGGMAYDAKWLQWALSLPEYIREADTGQDAETGAMAFMVDFHAVGEAPVE